MIDTGTPSCCINSCGSLVPLVNNGNYDSAIDGGKAYVNFNLSGSSCCGIPVASVLRGDLDGLEGRDELARLNPRSDSIRLRIEVSSPSPVGPFNHTNLDR